MTGATAWPSGSTAGGSGCCASKRWRIEDETTDMRPLPGRGSDDRRTPYICGRGNARARDADPGCRRPRGVEGRDLRYPMPIMQKSQYRWQMTQPVPATSPLTGCNPTGRSSVLWETLRELPVSDHHHSVQLNQSVILVEPRRRVVPPPLSPLLVLLPQHDAQDPDRVVVDALEVLPRVARLEVRPPSSQQRIEPLLHQVGEVPVLPGLGNAPDFPLDGRHRLGSRIVIGP